MYKKTCAEKTLTDNYFNFKKSFLATIVNCRHLLRGRRKDEGEGEGKIKTRKTADVN